MVFLKKSFFEIGTWHSRPPRDPLPFMANTILNFHFDYLNTSLITGHWLWDIFWDTLYYLWKQIGHVIETEKMCDFLFKVLKL